jgi:hypothetical protein
VKNCKYIIVRQRVRLTRLFEHSTPAYALKRVMARVCHVVLDINAIEIRQLTADFLERKTSWIPRQL